MRGNHNNQGSSGTFIVFLIARSKWLFLGLALCLLQTGCASFSDHMDAFPSRTGAPPYADDPEANGNPAKAWYN
jgi:hypothetical protein